MSCRGRVLDGKSPFFEILGFDILLDQSLQPWVLEVNRSPSFGTDSNLDLHVKTAVIRDALRLANIRFESTQHSYAPSEEVLVMEISTLYFLLIHTGRASYIHMA